MTCEVKMQKTKRLLLITKICFKLLKMTKSAF